MFKPVISDKAVTAIGGLLLGMLVISAWLPRPCPILSNAIGVCPQQPLTSINTAVITDEEREVNRYPHQKITSPIAYFTAHAQEYRKETAVRFFYRNNLANEIAFLQVKDAKGFRDINLITHPLLLHLSWAQISSPDYTLYQKDGAYNSQEAFLANLPPAKELAIDSLAAKKLSLRPDQYTLLDTLDTDTFKNIQYIYTNYTRPEPDGSWYIFDRTNDIQSAVVNSSGELEFQIRFLNKQSATEPFLLSTVHVDYKKMKP